MHTDRPSPDVVHLEEVDPTQVALVGGKGAGLAALARIEGVDVPAGFCVTTEAFRRIVGTAPEVDTLLEALDHLVPEDRAAIAACSAELRRAVEAVAIPADLAEAVTVALARLGERTACAVRSSSTAEDLPASSSAGQHDTALNVAGPAAVLHHLSRCWASLFTDRAVTYRIRSGIDHRSAGMAVVVQRLVVPDAAGTMFTAHPVTSNRTVVSVEASLGLGEAVVSGTVDPDVYEVRGGAVAARRIGTKHVAVRPTPGGGTHEEVVEPDRQVRPVLSDDQVVRLAALGRRIEAHLGSPQDIEWCRVGDDLHVVQSRPITTLFPIPAADDGKGHVYVSVGHQQMMTDAMKPLGLSLFQRTALRPMAEAGGRLFVDVTDALSSPPTRAGLLGALGRSDPLIGDALRTTLDRGDLVPSLPDDVHPIPPAGTLPAPIATDPSIVAALVERTEASVAALARDLEGLAGEALLDAILADVEDMRRLLLDPLSMQVITAAMEATWWLDEQLHERLGEVNAADALTRSVPGNVTSEMGLALLDVADAVRPHPEVVAFLGHVEDEGFLDELPRLRGGQEAHEAITAYLERYGMRCVGEIDVTRPRWSEQPSALVPVLLADVRAYEPGERVRRFERGRAEALRTEQQLLARLGALPDGARHAREAKRMIDRLRTFAGYREHPKYGIVSRYALYKRALWEEARRLVQAGVLAAVDDVAYLRVEELHEVVRTQEVDDRLIARRREEHRRSQALRAPRVLTSDGEVLAGSYRRGDLPAGALVGLPVSAGTVEGRARVVNDLAGADLEPGDILVTAHTDPAWSPLFVSISGLVTEVGGLMTHGAVIAREYGLPAIVGVEDATRRIPDGQRIRVDGASGLVELLPATSPAATAPS